MRKKARSREAQKHKRRSGQSEQEKSGSAAARRKAKKCCQMRAGKTENRKSTAGPDQKDGRAEEQKRAGARPEKRTPTAEKSKPTPMIGVCAVAWQAQSSGKCRQLTRAEPGFSCQAQQLMAFFRRRRCAWRVFDGT